MSENNTDAFVRALRKFRGDFTLTNATTFASALSAAPDGVFGAKPLNWLPREGESERSVHTAISLGSPVNEDHEMFTRRNPPRGYLPVDPASAMCGDVYVRGTWSDRWEYLGGGRCRDRDGRAHVVDLTRVGTLLEGFFRKVDSETVPTPVPDPVPPTVPKSAIFDVDLPLGRTLKESGEFPRTVTVPLGGVGQTVIVSGRRGMGAEQFVRGLVSYLVQLGFHHEDFQPLETSSRSAFIDHSRTALDKLSSPSVVVVDDYRGDLSDLRMIDLSELTMPRDHVLIVRRALPVAVSSVPESTMVSFGTHRGAAVIGFTGKRGTAVVNFRLPGGRWEVLALEPFWTAMVDMSFVDATTQEAYDNAPREVKEAIERAVSQPVDTLHPRSPRRERSGTASDTVDGDH